MNEGIIHFVSGGMENLERIARSDANVTITAEPGCQQREIAMRIHMLSPRCNKLFVPKAIGHLPEPLMEAELFGHERGAFTGVAGRKLSCFEIARGGTLFLEEIANVPLVIQDALGKAILAGSFYRISGPRPVEIEDVRIIATSSLDLDREVQAGRFSEKLHAVLSVGKVVVAPLRERHDLIAELAKSYLFSLHAGGLTLTDAALELLTGEQWLENIDELETVILQAAVDALLYKQANQVHMEHITSALQRKCVPPTNPSKFSVEEVERRLIEATVKHSGNFLQAFQTGNIRVPAWMIDLVKTVPAH